MIILLFLVLLAVVPGCSSSSNHSDANVQAANTVTAPPVAVQSAKVEVHQLQRTVSAVGSLDPNEEITVSNQVEGLVSRVFVDLGDFVKSGQPIAQLDTTELDLAVRQQTAALQQELARLGVSDVSPDIDDASTSQVRQADATYSEAKTQLERTKGLVSEGLIPKAAAGSAAGEVRRGRSQSEYGARERAKYPGDDFGAARVARSGSKETGGCKDHSSHGWVYQRAVGFRRFVLKVNSPVVTLVQNSPLKLRFEVPDNALDSVRVRGPVEFQDRHVREPDVLRFDIQNFTFRGSPVAHSSK
jgi:multidrug efflux pump subunit AcrA (membrane-fusion protein)